MDIRFPVAEFPVGKTYSFASSPTENDILISFKKGVSPFKQALEAVKPGDTLLITQYGSNDFHLHKNQHCLLIAGGIGIAPYRSMIKEVVDLSETTDITLLYFNQTSDFAFKHELDEWASKYNNLKLEYFVTADLKRKDRAKIITAHVAGHNGLYYVAGPPSMVVSTSSVLTALGVLDKDIAVDSFDGY
jgi:ferredoxin-NADP reductase